MVKPQLESGDKSAAGRLEPLLDCIKSNPLFSNLADEDISCFQNVAQVRLYKKEKILYVEEEPAKYFYIIISGWIKLFHMTREGEEVIVDMLTGSHIFGESALFAQDQHMCSAQVIEDAQLLSIPSKLLRDQIRSNPALAHNMMYSLSRHHRGHYSDLAFNAMLTAPQRIGYFLLRLCPKSKKENVVFHLPYDKALIAKTLGMKGATFSRALNILRQKTGIHINDARVEISSVAQLAKFVYGTVVPQ